MEYYNDGKQWLSSWPEENNILCLLKDFRITFYFGDKAEPLINSSDLPGR
jgi:hypothetical protein